MPAAQTHISASTPMGANLVNGGATFRVWAPAATEVSVVGAWNNWTPNEASKLIKQPDGRWTGFIPNLADGALYNFHVVGTGSSGEKRDPYARELENAWPNPKCILRRADTYPWHDGGWHPPGFHELLIYQFHPGTYYGPNRQARPCKFLDLLDRIEYLVDLGVNAIQPLPITEFSTARSMGYNGTDLFSPEMDYQAYDAAELANYLTTANRLLTARGQSPLTAAHLAVPINQMKAMIDICHVYGLAVLFDVVYNHASVDVRGQHQDQCLYFFDRQPRTNENNSLYFTDQDHTGPVFAFWKPEVRQFLIDNARFFVEEYHVDGFRYDQVTVIDQQNRGSGWLFCQHLNGTLRAVDPSVINIAEYWGPDPHVLDPIWADGADFDAEWHDGLRRSLRGILSQAAGGNSAEVQWQPVLDQLRAPGFRDAWRAVQCIESHDEVYRDRAQRIPVVAGGGNHNLWHARSRARVALGILLTAPGIPMLFMGQEFLEQRIWADDPANHPDKMIDWDEFAADKNKSDFHRFTRELCWLRRNRPALSAEGILPLHKDDYNRIMAFQRFVPGVGRNVVVVASLNENTLYNYAVPFPLDGQWFEIFNSDVFEQWVNPNTAGNGGEVQAYAGSATLTVPANSILVFARER